MKNILISLGTVAMATSLFACSSSSSSNNGTPSDSGVADHAVVDTGTGDTGPTAPPLPPALGAQIDRMGRPAITTALIHTFDTTAAKGPAKDAYNADTVPSHWSTYVPQMESNLAIYDGLDTVCGNQAGYGALGNPAYATLATVLAADTLWVNTTNLTCVQYLGVEFGALGISNTDCGGRTPTENVVDLTYNAVAGTLTPTTLPTVPGPVSNGILVASTNVGTTFPYLASPH